MASVASNQFLLGSLYAMLLCCSLMSLCTGERATASFVFGDSLVDAGNNNYIASLSKANFVPNGIDLRPYFRPTGRFTNGRTIPDIIGQELGLEDFVPPYLAPTTTGDVLLRGVNYASGGGGILNATGEIFGGRISLDKQIDNYANTRNEIISIIGGSAATRLLHKAIFSVGLGSNDFINNYLVPVTPVTIRKPVPPEVFIGSMISKYRLQLMRLYNLDARRFVVSNVGPIGCIPLEREMNLVGSGSSTTGCAAFPNQLAVSFNNKLKSLVKGLNTAHKDALFVYADIYSVVLDIIDNHQDYGFEVADSACCRIAGRFGGLVPCNPASAVCPDRSKYVFWDPYHPSEAANAIAARRLLDGDSDVVFPVNIRQLAQV